MPRKVLLLEPNYKNKYPPMGLMKLATYFRNRGDDVRFFKGDLRDLAVELLFEDFWEDAHDIALGEYTTYMRQYIKMGKLALLEAIPNFEKKQGLRMARTKYQTGDYAKFDVACVTTLFTFFWKETIETINASRKFVSANGRLLVGGIAASILQELVLKETGINPHFGLLDKPGMIDADSDVIIDELPLDYSIFEEIDYTYPANNAFFAYMTRGCIRHCPFCSVPRLEPEYRPYIGIKEQIEQTTRQFGAQKDLLLLDNNVFASNCFNKIIDEIKDCGFVKGALYKPASEYDVAINNIRNGYNVRTYVRKIVKIYDGIALKLSETEQGEFYNAREESGLLYADTANAAEILAFNEIAESLYNKYIYSKIKISRGRVRYIDFNQGVDARLMTDAKMKKLAEINIRPLRIAFDSWEEIPQGKKQPMREIYTEAIKLAAKYNITKLSNYLLYNTDNDIPDELFMRLELNIRLCEELDVDIYSFPMKYHPIDDPKYFNNRNFTGKAWNRKYIRAVQAVLNSTHGKIGRGKSFFQAAFGKDVNQYHEILLMPEAFIIERHKYDKTAYQSYLEMGGTRKIKDDDIARYGNMTDEWRNKLTSLTPKQRKQAEKIIHVNIFTDETCDVSDSAVREILQYYRIKRYEEISEIIAND
jgi:hypothetical protein